VGGGVARWGGGIVRAVLLPSVARPSGSVAGRPWAVRLRVTISVGMLTGRAPALYALGSDLSRAVGAGLRDTVSRQSRYRSALMAFPAALSVVCLVGAGLCVRSLNNVRSLRLGYDVEPIVVVTEKMRGAKLTDSA